MVMGILTNNINETGKQILEIEASVLENINAITFSIAQLKTQLIAMETNQEFVQEDIEEMKNLITDLNLKIKEL